MTIKELMVPRRKLLIKYPNCLYKVGDIFTLKDGWWFTNNHEQGGIDIDIYPEIFKEIFWWEDRKEEDMPEYVKYKFNGKIEKLRIFTINWTSYINEYLPATKEEYENQNL